jgi:hypothetical protein
MNTIIYRDSKNQDWSIDKGDWVGFQYQDEREKKILMIKKKRLYTLLIFPLVITIAAATVAYL